MVASKVSQFKNKQGKTIVVTYEDVGLKNPTIKEKEAARLKIAELRKEAEDGTDPMAESRLADYEVKSIAREADKKFAKKQNKNKPDDVDYSTTDKDKIKEAFGLKLSSVYVRPDEFNKLPDENRAKILTLKKELEKTRVVDVLSEISPYQAYRMSERELRALNKNNAKGREIEGKIIELMKTPNQVKADQQKAAQEAVNWRLTQLNSHIQFLKGTSKVKSSRMNQRKKIYFAYVAEKRALESGKKWDEVSWWKNEGWKGMKVD